MKPENIPVSTYRVQFSKEFRFLGLSGHCALSPPSRNRIALFVTTLPSRDGEANTDTT